MTPCGSKNELTEIESFHSWIIPSYFMLV
jgi:hypothetical protein